MEDQTNNEPVAGEPAHNEPTASELFDSVLAAIDPENCSVRDQLRSMFVLIEGVVPTDEQLDAVERAWPLAANLLTSLPVLITVDPWIRSLPDELFNRLFLLAEEFMEWNDPQDSATWESEFCFLAHVLATNERRCRATDEETIAAARVLVSVVGIEVQRRTGDYLYAGPYSVVSGQRPQTISAPESETGH